MYFSDSIGNVLQFPVTTHWDEPSSLAHCMTDFKIVWNP
jgi:hypothetical protein